jgi:threonine/homoserine/homoserine lactone efflux protein
VLGALIIGLILGFLGSMPIAGPTAAIVASRGLENRASSGLAISIGSAVGEAIYAFAAFWGITALMGRFPFILPASRLFGCVIIVGLGIYFVARRASPPPDNHDEAKGLRNVLLGFTIAIVNPTLIVTWTAAVGIGHATGLLRASANDAFPFALGAGAGIVGWFATLLWALGHFRARLQATTLDRVIRGMGVVLIVTGLGLGIRVLVMRPF